MRTRMVLSKLRKTTQHKASRLEAKLLSLRKVDEVTGCWLFTGPLREEYGYTTFKTKGYGVHQLSAYLYLGFKLSSKLQINHKPICPNRHCFNPEHLYIGNQSQNLTDYYKSVDDGLCPKGHSNIFMYEYTNKDGKKFRWCRQCRINARHSYWERKHK